MLSHTKKQKISLYKDNMKFSAAHFTIFSATQRERLHGHNFNVRVDFDVVVHEDGMISDYAFYKRMIEKMCRQWNEYTLMPKNSKYLKIEKKEIDDNDLYQITFNKQSMYLPVDEVLILDCENITVEELSRIMAENLVEKLLNKNQQNTASDKSVKKEVTSFEVSVYSGPGQCGTTFLQL